MMEGNDVVSVSLLYSLLFFFPVAVFLCFFTTLSLCSPDL